MFFIRKALKNNSDESLNIIVGSACFSTPADIGVEKQAEPTIILRLFVTVVLHMGSFLISILSNIFPWNDENPTSEGRSYTQCES